MKNYRLYLLRHGITKGNLDGRYIGKTDLPLCREGIIALAKQKRDVKYPNVQKLYVPPLRRCAETAQLLYPDAFLGLTEKLTEIDFGDFEGLTTDECAERYPDFYVKWLRGEADCPRGESQKAFMLRCVEGLAEIFADMQSGQVMSAGAVVPGGVIMNLLSGCGLPKDLPLRYRCEAGRGFEIHMSAYLWQTATAFEIAGEI